ncbi:delta-like protein 4 isoform X2 [Ricinus communis]|uniref:EGF-like domain-containing protein n=1 Tax=Ricinus communis TaxID=3988 RepID=B9RDV4_RICCO|nr:delta-like protein 4 isoform X2 [Ricinus communis]EEF50562.1 conserved hypothetical protein [Ricinus communis]|eukprot:XP_002511893.1 delta-like protein 4 [Ricinus communis]
MSTAKDFSSIVAVAILFLGSWVDIVQPLPCEDNTKCGTGSCDITGSCICNLPNPSTILDGDRPFLGGKHCDEEMIMCDGTNSFWCEHGGKCVEIVQGENYTCKCLPGFIGDHCEHSGKACGRIHCFHEAKCLVEDEICECPSDWKGNADCSLPTITQTESPANSTTTGIARPGENFFSRSNWVVVALAVSCSVGAVAGGAIYAKRLFSKKENAVPRFQQLSQMQSHDVLDDDEDGSMVHSNGYSHR